MTGLPTISFYCEQCGETPEYIFHASGPTAQWPEWREHAERNARSHHNAEICTPRRRLYRVALAEPEWGIRLKGK